MIVAPCKNCELRELHCHSKCKDYLTYDNERKQVRDKNNRRNSETYSYLDRLNAYERVKGSKNRSGVFKSAKR